MKKFFLIIAVMYSVSALVSCGQPRFVVATQLSPPLYEKPAAPGPGYIWIDGDWIVENRNYIWHEGHWNKPRGHKTWQAGHWENGNNGWYWVRGRWQ